MTALELVSVEKNGSSLWRSNRYLTIQEALDIQERQLKYSDHHPQGAAVRAEIEKRTDIEGCDRNVKLHISEINRRVPRGGDIEAVIKKLTPLTYWDKVKPISRVACSDISNTLNRDLPQFEGNLYITLGHSCNSQRHDLGYRDNTNPEAYEQAMLECIKYFKRLGYKACRARSTWQSDNRFRGAWVYCK